MHQSVLVVAGSCTVAELANLTFDEIEERLWRRLTPHIFDPDGVVTLPDGAVWAEPEFDTARIGGGFRGHFVARTGPALLGSPGVHESLAIEAGTIDDRTERMLSQRRTDVLRAADIDWLATRSVALADSAEWYDKCASTGWALDGDRLRTSDISRDDYIAADQYTAATAAICDENGWREMSGDRWDPVWTQSWRDYVDTLDPDTLLVVVDCGMW